MRAAFRLGWFAAVLMAFVFAAIPLAHPHDGGRASGVNTLEAAVAVVLASLAGQSLFSARWLPFASRVAGCYVVWCGHLWFLWNEYAYGFWWCDSEPFSVVPSLSCLFIFTAFTQKHLVEVTGVRSVAGWWLAQRRLGDRASLAFGAALACLPLAVLPWIEPAYGERTFPAARLLFAVGVILPLSTACCLSLRVLYRLPCWAAPKLVLTSGAILLWFDLWLRVIVPRSYPSGRDIADGLVLFFFVAPIVLGLLLANAALCLWVHYRKEPLAGAQVGRRMRPCGSW